MHADYRKRHVFRRQRFAPIVYRFVEFTLYKSRVYT